MYVNEKLRAGLFHVTFPGVPELKAKSAPAPLLLLLRVNMTQGWRRLLAVREQSHLLTSIIGLFIVGYLVLSFWLFYDGLRFLAKFPGLGAVLTERLMFVLFAFLFGLLLLSNLVIGYTNLFRNRETAFLLTLPVSTETVFQLEIHRVHGSGLVGVFIFDCAAARGLRPGARSAVAFLCFDDAADRPCSSCSPAFIGA